MAYENHEPPYPPPPNFSPLLFGLSRMMNDTNHIPTSQHGDDFGMLVNGRSELEDGMKQLLIGTTVTSVVASTISTPEPQMPQPIQQIQQLPIQPQPIQQQQQPMQLNSCRSKPIPIRRNDDNYDNSIRRKVIGDDDCDDDSDDDSTNTSSDGSSNCHYDNDDDERNENDTTTEMLSSSFHHPKTFSFATSVHPRINKKATTKQAHHSTSKSLPSNLLCAPYLGSLRASTQFMEEDDDNDDEDHYNNNSNHRFSYTSGGDHSSSCSSSWLATSHRTKSLLLPPPQQSFMDDNHGNNQSKKKRMVTAYGSLRESYDGQGRFMDHQQQRMQQSNHNDDATTKWNHTTNNNVRMSTSVPMHAARTTATTTPFLSIGERIQQSRMLREQQQRQALQEEEPEAEYRQNMEHSFSLADTTDNRNRRNEDGHDMDALPHNHIVDSNHHNHTIISSDSNVDGGGGGNRNEELTTTVTKSRRVKTKSCLTELLQQQQQQQDDVDDDRNQANDLIVAANTVAMATSSSLERNSNNTIPQCSSHGTVHRPTTAVPHCDNDIDDIAANEKHNDNKNGVDDDRKPAAADTAYNEADTTTTTGTSHWDDDHRNNTNDTGRRNESSSASNHNLSKSLTGLDILRQLGNGINLPQTQNHHHPNTATRRMGQLSDATAPALVGVVLDTSPNNNNNISSIAFSLAGSSQRTAAAPAGSLLTTYDSLMQPLQYNYQQQLPDPNALSLVSSYHPHHRYSINNNYRNLTQQHRRNYSAADTMQLQQLSLGMNDVNYAAGATHSIVALPTTGASWMGGGQGRGEVGVAATSASAVYHEGIHPYSNPNTVFSSIDSGNNAGRSEDDDMILTEGAFDLDM